MRNDGVAGPGITSPRFVDRIAALPEHVPNRIEIGVEQNEVAREATGDLLHGLQRPDDIVLSRSALPHAKGPLSKLVEHPQDQGRIAGREHDGDPAAQEGELTTGRPETRADLIFQLLQGANAVLSVIRSKKIPSP